MLVASWDSCSNSRLFRYGVYTSFTPLYSSISSSPV